MSDKTPRDCTIIGGDEPVIISRTTAEYALAAMKKRLSAGDYAHMMADDRSFVGAGIRELEKATGEPL